MDDAGQTLYIVLALVVILAVAYLMAFWTRRAGGDRSALVGLYLVIGFPGFLLALLGLARLTSRNESGLMWLACGLGLVMPLLLPIRSFLSRYMPFDPKSAIDMVGLSLLLGLMGFLGGQYATEPDPVDAGSIGVAELTSQFVAFAILAYILVGFGLWRMFPEATARLGLTSIRPRTLAIAFGAVIAGFIFMVIAGGLTAVFQPDFNREIEQATEGITQGVSSPVGAVFFGLGAGISEELLLRGAIQPRFGLVFTSVLFALLHNQYGVTFILAGVFAMGMVLGLERKYFGTTAAILTHAIFNAIAVLAGS